MAGAVYLQLTLVFLTYVQGSIALYQWRCSEFDSMKQRYYFPDLGGQATVLRRTWEDSIIGMSYIYPIPASDLSCRGGSVTDVEFCYTASISNVNNARGGRVFTLLILLENGGQYSISESLDVMGTLTPDTTICSNSGKSRMCCEVMTLDTNNRFLIPEQNFSIGVTVPSPATNAQSQGFLSSDAMYAAQSRVLSGSLLQSLNVEPLLEQGLRLFWLHTTLMTTVRPTTINVSSTTETTSPPPTEPVTTSLSTTDGDTVTIEPSTTESTSTTHTISGGPVSSSALEPSGTTTLRAITNQMTTDAQISLSMNSNADDFPTVEVDTGSVDAIAAIGGTLGTVVIFCAILLIGILFVIFLLKYKRQKRYSQTRGNRDIMLSAFASPTYDLCDINNPNEKPVGSSTMESKMEQYYSDIGPSINGPLYDILQEDSHTEYEDIYVVPATDISGLYSQIDEIAKQNVCRENIRIGECIGSGQFGSVYKGVWKSAMDSVDVAIKTLINGSTEDDTVKFLQEAAIMAQFKHPNVVTMYGVVKDKEPILLILEMLTKGDLRNYLLSMNTEQGEVCPEIDCHELLSYCRQVASGMAYLANKQFVHRDLAARNILVSDDGICKIADFGMSRDLMNESYYISHGGMIPVKWTAPEALFYKKYSTASDVWSYGIVMYEIWSVGKKPFESVFNSKVLEMVSSGYRLPPPPGCSYAIYNIMMSCWHPEASLRPKFSDICTQLSVSNSKLLHWSREDKTEYPEATRLGAGLSCSEKLYERVQSKYKDI